jgi:hypothetical protein
VSEFNRDKRPSKDADVLDIARYWLRYSDECGTPSGFSVTVSLMPCLKRMVHEIEALQTVVEIAEQALDLADEYSGGESESADHLRLMLDTIKRSVQQQQQEEQA